MASDDDLINLLRMGRNEGSRGTLDASAAVAVCRRLDRVAAALEAISKMELKRVGDIAVFGRPMNEDGE